MFELTPALLQIWVATGLSIFVYSFLFKDNPTFKFAEHLYVGSAIGYGVVLMIQNINTIAITPMNKGDFTWIMPLALGALLYTRFSSKYYWTARYPLAFIVSVGIGLTIRSIITSDFIVQIRSTIINPLSTTSITGVPKTPFNNILVIVITVTTLFYFIFTGGKKLQNNGVVKGVNYLARLFMMVAFGSAFGNTVMTRVSFLIDRIRYMTQPDAYTIIPIVLIVVAAAMVPKEWLTRSSKK